MIYCFTIVRKLVTGEPLRFLVFAADLSHAATRADVLFTSVYFTNSLCGLLNFTLYCPAWDKDRNLYGERRELNGSSARNRNAEYLRQPFMRPKMPANAVMKLPYIVNCRGTCQQVYQTWLSEAIA